ncbi:MAG TPA: PAS domain-containing sensor histidine kinase [Anaerolineae bacterium]|nr:PAS domain-containing sensor histidine kinase [Anaerolineae bacterium]
MNQSTGTANTPRRPPTPHAPQHRWMSILYGAGVIGALNLGFWVADALWRFTNPAHLPTASIYPPPTSWTQALFQNIPPYTWFMRALWLGLTLLGGILCERLWSWQNRRARAGRASEQHYRALFENAPVSLCVTTQDGRLLEYNAGLRQLQGFADTEVAQINVWNWYANPADRKQLLAQLQDEGYTHRYETKLNRVDGAGYEASVTSTLIPLGDQEVILTVLEDNTEANRLKNKLLNERSTLARQVEEHTAALLRTNAELTQALRVKDEFLAIMSHELRTPLTIMMTLADNLYQEIYGPLSERQRAQLRSIQESGYNLLSLINDLVDLAKIGAGQLKLQHTPFTVRQVCELALQAVRAQAQKKTICLSLEIDPTVEVMVADAGRIRQMLTKLLHNAIKFTPAGGQAGLEVRGDADQAGVHFVVWDTGIGIPPEKISQLFQSFNQLDTSSTRDHDGTGIGLALVERLTHLHEGVVSVQSHPGEGSRFTISLPWRKP